MIQYKIFTLANCESWNILDIYSDLKDGSTLRIENVCKCFIIGCHHEDKITFLHWALANGSSCSGPLHPLAKIRDFFVNVSGVSGI